VARGKRAAQPRELIRLTPGQFSAAVAFIVLLVGAGFLTGYVMGIRAAGNPTIGVHATGSIAEEKGEEAQAAMEHPVKPEQAPTMTFYEKLTENKVVKTPVREPEKRRKPVPKPLPVEVPGNSEVKTVDKTPPAAGDGIMIQVGSYREGDKADSYLKDLSALGYQGLVTRADLGPRGVWYRVQLGPYKSEGRARKVLDKLQKEMSIKGFIVR